MIKVAAVIGSPRNNGETYKNVQKFELRLKKLDENIDFSYIFLKDAHIEQCKGCGVCLAKGEEYCPIKDDDKNDILRRIMESDGIIFGVPVYSLHVPALTKNLLDRFAYILHRPCFFHKSFMSIAVQGVYGDKNVIKYLEEFATFSGFKVCRGFGITNTIFSEEMKKNDKLIEENAKRFYQHLMSPTPSPGIYQLMMFRWIRSSKPYIAEDCPKDYQYFKEKGWLESPYFYDIELNLIKKIIGAWADRQGMKLGEKIKKQRMIKVAP
ncbi:Iron-sulfur flavoprotein [uncultured archaeon]|nr:Iron-sulfur flavoprotein [uncultured archaeon]